MNVKIDRDLGDVEKHVIKTFPIIYVQRETVGGDKIPIIPYCPSCNRNELTIVKNFYAIDDFLGICFSCMKKFNIVRNY
jgi:hypothetical protein